MIFLFSFFARDFFGFILFWIQFFLFYERYSYIIRCTERRRLRITTIYPSFHLFFLSHINHNHSLPPYKSPPILPRRMPLSHPRPQSIAQIILSHRLSHIPFLQDAPLPQLRPQISNNILKRIRRDRITNIKPIHIRFFNPLLHNIRDRLWTPHSARMCARNCQLLQHVLFRPFHIFEARNSFRPRVDEGLNCWRTIFEREIFVVIGKLGEVGPCPASEEGRGTF